MPQRPIHCLNLALVFTLLLCGSLSAEAQLATITVQVRNPDPASGTAEVSLFNSAESFMREPFLQQSGTFGEDENSAPVFTAVFVAVPTGEYAVVVAHDANDNGQLDGGFLGFGGEDYGWSNNVHPWFGWPDFDDAKFTVEADTEIDISLE